MNPVKRLTILHPVTWWSLGLALAITAGISTNPYVLLFIMGICSIAILIARSFDTTLAKSNLYFWFAGLVIITRILFRIVFNYSSASSDIIFTLPRFEIDLGIGGKVGLFGALSKQTLLAALTDGLRLSAIILSIAFATTFSNPRQLLKSTPAALFEIASAISVAINLAPQLIKSIHRVRRARALRGKTKGLNALNGMVIPVLEDTLDKSLELAASMDSRGFGRRGSLTNVERITARFLSLGAMLAIAVGIFFLLASDLPSIYAIGIFVLGVACSVISIRLTSIRSNRTKHRIVRRTVADYLIYAFAVLILGSAIAGWIS